MREEGSPAFHVQMFFLHFFWSLHGGTVATLLGFYSYIYQPLACLELYRAPAGDESMIDDPRKIRVRQTGRRVQLIDRVLEREKWLVNVA